MKWIQAPASLVAQWDALFPPDPRAEKRKMFGYPAGFVNGNLFGGLFQDSMMLRLGEADREKFLAIPGAALFEPMPGRPMKEYVGVPRKMLGDEKALRKWIASAFEHTASMPAKKKKAKAPKKR